MFMLFIYRIVQKEETITECIKNYQETYIYYKTSNDKNSITLTISDPG